MKMRPLLLTAISFICLSCFSGYADINTPFGFVDFATCMKESNYGKREKQSLETMQEQMQSMMKDAEKEHSDMTSKLNDPEYIESLSPEAEETLKTQHQDKSEELAHYQNQFYQILNQANMRLFQVVLNYVEQATEAVAKKEKIQMVLNKEACFYADKKYDITRLVIKEMDRAYEEEEKGKETQNDSPKTQKPSSTSQEGVKK